MKKGIIIFAIICFPCVLAQAHNEVVSYLNLPTAQTTGEQIVLFDVGHRYLDVNRHTTNVNITFGYGITNRFDVYAAYSFKNKDSILSSKLNLLNDTTDGGSVLSLAVLAGAGYKDVNEINNSVSLSYMDSTDRKSVYVLDKSDRFSYFGQIIIEKHFFTNMISLGVVPTFAHNTNFYGFTSKSDSSFGSGGVISIYFLDRFALTGEAVVNLAGFAFKYMNYNAGIKYSGFRHTFALWIGNSSGYSPVEYIAGSAVQTPKICASFTREFDI